MGCSDSKQAAITELNSVICQMKEENSKLNSECEKLKGENTQPVQKSAKKEFKVTFESLLQTLDNLAKDLDEEKIDLTDTSLAKIGEILEYESNLSEKLRKIKDLVQNKATFLDQQEILDTQIRESEQLVKNLESIYFASDPNHIPGIKSSEIDSKKQDLLLELEKAEQVLNELNEEIRKSNIEDLASSDLGGIENLLTLNDSQVEFELKKVDLELEELNDQIKSLKNKETELQHLENYVNRSQTTENAGKTLTEQIRESEALVEMLEDEKNKVKEEISQLKKANLADNDLDEKLTALNEMIEKRKSKEKSSKVVSESLVSDIQATLLKAKILEQDLRNRVV